MKKLQILAAIAALVSINSSALNTITLGDSVRIHPVHLDGYSQHPVVMYNDGFCDSWTMGVAYPEGLMVKLVSGITPLDGMSIPYHDRYGNKQICTVELNAGAAYRTISSEITTTGWWDYDEDGLFEPYGTVKWSAGAHNLFEFNFYLDPAFRGGYILMDGRITSGSDQRGAVLQDVRFLSKTWVWIGYMPGDVTGNERINIDDVSALISYLVTDEGLDEWGIVAADANRDGKTTIADVTWIINQLLI
jgi:hypothetical protein